MRSKLATAAVSPADGQVALGPNLSERNKLISEIDTLIKVLEGIEGDGSVELDWRTAKFIGQAWIKSWVLRNPQENDRSTASLLREMKEHRQAILDASALEQQLLDTLLRNDRTLYSPIYLDAEPFLRLHLQPLFIGGRDKDTCRYSNPDELIECSITLLMHSTGICVLTIAVPTPGGVSSEELLPLTQSFSFEYSYGEIAEPLISAGLRDMRRPESSLAGSWKEEVAGGVRWRALEMSTPENLSGVFSLYRDAIHQVTGSHPDFHGWHCYPVLFVNALGCTCSSRDDWLEGHEVELHEVAVGAPTGHEFRRDALSRIVGDNVSDLSTEDLFVLSSGTTRVFWTTDDDSEITFDDCQSTLGVVENVLIQYWHLNRYYELVSTERRDLRQIEILQRELIDGLNEHGQNHYSWGTAQDLAQIISEKKKIPHLYKRNMDRTASLQSLISTRQAVLNARRSTGLAAIALLATAILGLPSLATAVKYISNNTLTRELLKIEISTAVQSYVVATVWLCSLFGIAVFVLFQLKRQSRARRIVRSAHQFGHFPREGVTSSETHETEGN